MYRIAICDDDVKYVDFIESIIKTYSEYSSEFLIYKFYSGEDFLKNLDEEFDLVFLDMQMGKIDGITAAWHLRKFNQDAILVFCTGVQLPKPEFFDVQPFRYLMKNYSKSKLESEMNLIIEKMIESKKDDYLVALSDGKMNKININDITYISNLKRGCCIHVFLKKKGQCFEIVSNKKLREIYDELQNKHFEYAHNSYIVNLGSIIAIKRDVLTLEDLTTLNISRSKRNIFHNKFAKYLGGKYKRE